MSLQDRAARDFLSRMDQAWVGLFAIAGLFLAPFVQPLMFGPFNIRMLMIFMLLSAGIVIPFIIETYAVVSGSAYLRLISLIMVPTSFLSTGSVLLWAGFWEVYLPRKVLADMVLFIGMFDGALVTIPIFCISKKLYTYFQRNLKRRNMLPSFLAVRKHRILILFFYYSIAHLAIFVVFHG